MPEIRKVAVRVTSRDAFGQAEPWNMRQEVFEERFEPAQGLSFFDVFRDAATGEPVSPDNALDIVLAGGVIMTDFDKASSIVHRLSTEARLGAETARYQRVLG